MFPFNSVIFNTCLNLSVLLFLVYKYLTRYYNYWEKKGVVFRKPLLLFGNLKDFFLMKSSLGDIYTELYREYEDEQFVGVFKSSRPDLLIRDLDAVKSVLIKDFNYFVDRQNDGTKTTELLLMNLFALEGEKWKILRHKMTPLFSSGKLKNMFPLIVETGAKFQSFITESIIDGEETEVYDLFAKYTTDVIGSCGFGVTLHSMTDNNAPFRVMGRKFFDPNYMMHLKLFIKSISPSLFSLFKMRVFDKDIEDFFLTTVKEILRERKNYPSNRHDFIDLMIELREKSKYDDLGIEFTDEFITAQAFIFFSAGFETSSNVMAFALHEMALQPEVQLKLQNEIDSVLEKYDGNVTYESVFEMKYLDMVMREVGRKYPPITVLKRVCNSTYTFPGTTLTIEKGVSVGIPAYALHYDPKYYPDPEKFIPERFSSEAIHSRHPMLFLPFGEGPRNCIGLRMGKLQSAVGLVSFLSKFSVEPSNKTETKLIHDPKSFVTASKNGIWLQVNYRKQK